MTTSNHHLQQLLRETFALNTFPGPDDVEHDEPLNFREDAWQFADLDADDGRSAPVWSLEDVLDLRPDLSDAQAWAVLRRCQAEQDPEGGVSRALAAHVADELFGGGDGSGDPDLLAECGDESDANLIDFAADARHWCQAEGRDFDTKLELAQARFQAATSHE